MELDPDTRQKLANLINWFKEKESVLVAFSGGVDSSLAATAAKIALGDKALAVTADSMTMPPWELVESKRVAKEIGVRHMVIKVDELCNPNFVENPPNRCYHCKKELISELKKTAREQGIQTIADGTNADDLIAHRPGALALREEGVRSPLAEVGITKADARKIASSLGLTTADKPSMACLATRFPYGEKITFERLSRVAEAEKFIRALIPVRQLRVRYHGDVARVEVGRQERKLLFDERIIDSITRRLKALGFKYVTMDLEGYRSGSMDEVLKERIIPRAKK